MKKWVVKNRFKNGVSVHKNPLIGNLLVSRNIILPEKVEGFLNPKIEDLKDPFLLRDMERAIERIDEGIKRGEKIVIYGDYDVDGITSISILYTALKKIGADVSYYIPERILEGYGINEKAIDYIKSIGTKLIITVDCGITAIDEVNYAKSIGIDVIVTDHHECGEEIPNTVVINPKRKDCTYPFKELAGCGVAFKLVQALWIKYNLEGCEEFLDICSIGTIADIVDLKGENRVIVKLGIERLKWSKRSGILALKAVSGIEGDLNSYNIAFQIAPRINSAGRLSDAKIAVELFITNDYYKASQIAKYLDNENKNRQKIEDDILKEALELIDNAIDLKMERVIILSSKNWHIGVVGIVASRIVEMFNRPAILLCEEDSFSRGSGRSIEGFNLFKAISECEDILFKYGGHELAAGVTIETAKIEEFRKKMNSIAITVDSQLFQSKINVDMDIPKDFINIETAEIIKKFEPFGAGNPSPVFCMEGLRVLSKREVGNKGKHLKLVLGSEKNTYDCIMFGVGNQYSSINWELIDAAFNIDINEWNNKKRVQLILKDIKPNRDWMKKNIKENYYRIIKDCVDYEKGGIDFSKINFITKDIGFLNEFIFFKRGYLLVTSLESLDELDLYDKIEINMGVNKGQDTQIIVCPRIEDIDFGKNEILIYDFLPGLNSYRLLENRCSNSIYHFNSNSALNRIDNFILDTKVEEDLFLKFYRDLMYNEVVGTMKDISIKYNTNVYKIFKMMSILKKSGILDIFVKGEMMKLKLNSCIDESKLKSQENLEGLNLLKERLSINKEGFLWI